MNTPLHTCARPFAARATARPARRSGVALVVTLGILAMICVAVIAFIAAMRLERSTASLEADRATLRGFHHVALASAMQEVTWQLNNPPQFRSRVYPVIWQSPTSKGPCFGSFYEQGAEYTFAATSVKLFSGAATNLVPGAVHADAAAVESVWLPVTSVLVDEPEAGQPGDPLAPLLDNVVIGRIAYLVIDCSGFLPPTTTNRLDTSLDPEAADDEAAGVGPRYAAQVHLPAERRDLTFYLAHDPDPEQAFTVRPEYYAADRPPFPGLFSTLVTNKFDLNSWTNGLLNLAEGAAPLAFDTATPWLAADAIVPWSVAAAQGFYAAGFEKNQAEKLTWNLLNLLDADRIPQYRPIGGATALFPPSRVPYGFEDLPMINEVVVSDVTSVAGKPAYSVSVELWYPFEPEQSPENLVLAVGVYTNGPPDVSSIPAPSENLGPFGFTNVVPLLHSPGRQFHVAASTEYVVFAPEAADQPPPTIGTDHPIYIWPRLYLLDTNTATYVCVDEALIEAPSGTDTIDNFDNVDIIEWRSTGSWQARNPFFNLVSGDGDFGDSSTLWERNDSDILDPGFEYPLFHLNRPLLSLGELGYLGLAQAGTGTVALASVEGAALLDRFTALPTNRLERASASRIQPNSPYPGVIAELLRDPVFSRPVGDADIPSVDTITNAWFAARTEDSWNTFAELLPAFAAALGEEMGEPTDDAEAVFYDDRKLPRALLIEDLLRWLPEQVTFRQNLYVILVAAQRLVPSGRATADQRAAIIVIRDAYTGRWSIHDWIPLDE